ncbi:hypothetical protein [Paraburkholderia solisilvae]|uniref:Uncharacterized protein n=1 Tax=Paraburkholderia solisilvae TaxID=624376 RepID=A0A6J5E4U0_9BURK|nr:hypothetical protein [Paraburkholderia solisilvae]CAB3761373.1 hypothetical protein LMG29739_03619 [Paraburkholderia solisilvae]
MHVSSNSTGGGSRSHEAANEDPELVRARRNAQTNYAANGRQGTQTGNGGAPGNNAAAQSRGGNAGAKGTSGTSGTSGTNNGAGQKQRSTQHEARADVHSGGNHGVWLGVGALGLPGQYAATRQNPVPANYVGAAANTTMTAAEYLAWAARNRSPLIAGGYRAGMGLGALVNTGFDAYYLKNAAVDLSRDPQSQQAQWNFADATVHMIANGVAMVLTPLAPAIGFATLALPNFSEVGHALQLNQQQAELEKKGQDTESAEVGKSHTLASLNATPVVSWFAPFYTKALTPEIEKFERAHGNSENQPAPSEFPPGTANDPAVVDYYGNAMSERAQRTAQHMLPVMQQRLKEAQAQAPGTDTVTLVARWPQTFFWPSSAPPTEMRRFDRAIALTYAAKSGSVVATWFGRDIDGTYRLPEDNHGIALRPDARHQIFYSQIFTPGEPTPVFPDKDSALVRQA